MKSKYFLVYLAASVLIAACSPEDASQKEQGKIDDPNALHHCDELASHPHDPNRYSAGVSDEQFAPGAAIEACSAAVQSNPDIPRLHFQLGRAYWIATKDTEAFSEFIKAAQSGYAPAMKFIGDAYFFGRGLPPSEKQDAGQAIAWYKKSSDGGFKDADKALDEVNEQIAEQKKAAELAKLNPNLFQNPDYIARIYNNDLARNTLPMYFYTYARAFVDFVASNESYFVAKGCMSMSTFDLQQGIAYEAINRFHRDAGGEFRVHLHKGT